MVRFPPVQSHFSPLSSPWSWSKVHPSPCVIFNFYCSSVLPCWLLKTWARGLSCVVFSFLSPEYVYTFHFYLKRPIRSTRVEEMTRLLFGLSPLDQTCPLPGPVILYDTVFPSAFLIGVFICGAEKERQPPLFNGMGCLFFVVFPFL